jgi:hypothetical protein
LDDSPKTKTACPGTDLLHFLVPGVLPARIAKLSRLHPLGVLLLVFRRGVIAIFAIPALQRDNFPHRSIPFPRPNSLLGPVAFRHRTPYSMISVTAPAPTVCPPSRIAKRKPFSSATGVISDTSQLTLSPGITISTPAGNFTSPVTSVVRK